jgi:hypothetical protein
MSGQTMLPEQPMKEQNKSFGCLLVASTSSAGEEVFVADVGDVISTSSQYCYWQCS